MGMDSTTRMGLLLGLAGAIAREDHADPVLDAALPVLLTIGDVTACPDRPRDRGGAGRRHRHGAGPGTDRPRRPGRPERSPVDRSTAPCLPTGGGRGSPGSPVDVSPATWASSSWPGPAPRPRRTTTGCARAGADDPRRRTRASPVAGGSARSHRAGEQRPAAGEHGGLRLAHPHGHEHLVRPAVPDLRARAAVLPPQLREVPLADPPRRPGAHLRAAPARLRHG